WHLGYGQSGTGAAVNHSYAEDGLYTVSLTTTNDCGMHSISQVVRIITSPLAAFEANLLMGCAPTSISFNNLSSSNATTFIWSFPGGNPSTSTSPSPVIEYDNPGTYGVSLVASNSAGSNSVTLNDYITIEAQATAAFSINSLSGANVQFQNNSSDALSYFWTFGNGQSSDALHPTYTFPEDGDYEIRLVAYNDCGSDTSRQNLSIVTPPTAGFEVGMPTGCVPMNIQFNDQSSSNTVEWEWLFPGGQPESSNEASPMVLYTEAGTYSVSLTVRNAAGSDFIIQNDLIVIGQKAEAGFSETLSGLDLTLENTSLYANSYLWDFGDGQMSTSASPNHSYAAPGTYALQLIASNDCGADTLNKNISTINAPEAAFAANLQAGCAPLVVNFTDESVGLIEDRLWDFPGGNPASSTAANPVVVYAEPGTYAVGLSVNNAVGESQQNIQDYIVVDGLPTANFSYVLNGPNLELTNNSINADRYEWNFGDGSAISTMPEPNHQYTSTGTYLLRLKAINDCGETIAEEEISLEITSTADAAWLREVLIFPNPNSGLFHLQASGPPKAQLSVRLLNILGQSVYERQLDFQLGWVQSRFELGDLPAGAYLLELRAEGEQQVRKLIIE
ncbi:MAG: PKD domain-containing protein, partial [Bacteroidota bacterium]